MTSGVARSIKNKDLAKVVRGLIRDDGWTMVNGGKHLKLVAPDGSEIIAGKHATDPRALKNFLADIRRIKNLN